MNWSNESYNMNMGMMIDNMNITRMNLPPMNPMHMNPPPMNPPPPVPLPLIGPVLSSGTNIGSEDLNKDAGSQENQANDVSSTQNQKPYLKYRSNRRDRDSKSSDSGRNRSRSSDRQPHRFNDRNRREKTYNNDSRSKWDLNDKILIASDQMIRGLPMGNMNQPAINMGMIPGMMHYASNNMIPGNMMMNNTNMMIPHGIEGPQMMIPNMMGTMIPNLMDNNMIMMNQQMMPPVHNQIFVSNGVLLPPTPGIQIPERRDPPKGCRTILVGGLPPDLSEDILKEMFLRFGSIDEVKLSQNGVYYVRFVHPGSVETSFHLSGYKFRFHDQLESGASIIFIDYALNRDDQIEYEKFQRKRETPTPPRIEPFTSGNLASITEKIKSETEFIEAAPTLAGWLERGECNKKFANQFYSLIQASNNQTRRLYNEKMQMDEEFQTAKSSIKDKLALIVTQFEQVAKILSAAKHQRASDHFTKQQRRNIDMWLKMTEEVENIKEEYNSIFDDEEVEKSSKTTVSIEMYDKLKKENENLTYELEGYKNEVYLAKEEAERKFEKFKAHFIAQQALQNKMVFPPLPQTNVEPPLPSDNLKPKPPPPTHVNGPLPQTEAKLISILTSFLMVHPLGASIDYLVSYVKSMISEVSQATVLSILQKYSDIFNCKTTGVGACIEHRWYFVTFEIIKKTNK